MILCEKWVQLQFMFAILLGATLFLYGFFPLSYSSNERAESQDLPEFIDEIALNKSIYGRHVSRTVFMVIDAMRTDFIQNQENTSMKYVNKMINDGTACMVNLNVKVPTVTMPRIKAMTTGTIPNFIDVVLNLGNSELNMDSLLHQIYDNGGKMVFCGDDTWVKMFPEMFHRKLENQDSLFVNDFYEGDKNITKKLSVELKRNDWELLILHFLGLDHIGHVEGPFSPKVPAKLREMDTVALHIHLALQHWMQTSKEPPLFIITGDHGMRDSGGHGGSTYPEINVPLIFAGPSCSQTDESYNQIDLPVTLSVLFGLPIPASSIGVIIPSLLNALSMEQKLFAYYYNADRLLQKWTELNGVNAFEQEESNFFSRFIVAKNAHKAFLNINNSSSKATNEHFQEFLSAERNYLDASRAMSRKLAENCVNFNQTCIVIGLICLVLGSLNVALTFVSNNDEARISLKNTSIFGVIASLLHYNFYENSFTQLEMYYAIPLIALIYFMIALNSQLLLRFSGKFETVKSLKALKSTNLFSIFLTFGIILHGFSTISSSFIEEEHQIWYYLNNTVWIILYLMETRHHLNAKDSKKETTNESIIQNQLKWALLFCGHLIARRLNQTGDKYLNTPDIGDWLQMEEHRTWLSLFVSISLLILYLTCMDFGSILTNVLTITACMLIYYYRTLKGSVYMAGILVKPSQSTDTCIWLFWLNIGEIAAINFVPILYNALISRLKRFDIKLIFATIVVLLTLVITLTHKPHNIFLIPILLFSCNKVKQMSELFCDNNSKSNAGLLVQCVLHLWIGKQFFFYQGNSNSLASIDLNAGYIGLNTFNFIAVGLFLTINTFSGPILSFLVFIHNSYDCKDKPTPQTNEKRILPLIMLLITFPFTLYVFIILAVRQHIFIWSVFSPKLLYDFYHLCLMYLMWSFVRLIPNLE